MAENPFSRAIKSRKIEEPESPVETVAQTQPTPMPTPPEKPVPELIPQTAFEQKKRGRPATGKRSDDSWIGRTFYIQRETDFDIEAELLQLERGGFKLDKSELVEKLLAAWVKWRNGEDSEMCLGEISPRRK